MSDFVNASDRIDAIVKVAQTRAAVKDDSDLKDYLLSLLYALGEPFFGEMPEVPEGYSGESN